MSEKEKKSDINLDRRSFLKSAAAAGAIATTGAIAPIAVAQSASGKTSSCSDAKSLTKEKYPHLFSPIKIANHTYKNRILCAPMLFAFYALGEDSAERVYKIVEDRAKGGVAEVVVGELPINFKDAASPMLPGLDVDFSKRKGRGFEAYKKYADIIKKHGTIALIEIFHGGIRAASPMDKEKRPWGPMGFVREDGLVIEAFDSGKMKKVCNDFAECADFMKVAGFDGICIHGGHGYLFTQFLSPSINQRTDELWRQH